MIYILLCLLLLGGNFILLQAQCPLPIEIMEHEYECSDNGSVYAVTFSLNRNDVQIESEAAYEMYQKVDGSYAFFGIPANKNLSITIESTDSCKRNEIFDIPECAIYIPTIEPITYPVITNPYKVLMPTAFSPNGDGKNDDWFYVGQNIQSLNVKVFNRWGNLIFEEQGISASWNGTQNNQPVPSGMYVYYVQIVFDDGTPVEQKGNVMVIR